MWNYQKKILIHGDNDKVAPRCSDFSTTLYNKPSTMGFVIKNESI